MENRLFEQLCDILVALDTQEQAGQFLRDFLSADELEKLTLRLEIMRMLSMDLTRGKIQESMAAYTDAPSLATISRANSVIKHGSGVIQNLLVRIGRT